MGPTSQLRERSRHPRGRVRDDGMGGGPAAAPQARSDKTMGRTDTDGNNNFPGVKSNYKIYKAHRYVMRSNLSLVRKPRILLESGASVVSL